MVFEPPPSPIKHGDAERWGGGLTSEGIGSFYSQFKPSLRPRPASDCTIQMRNRAISEGYVSSEAIGGHTGVTPRRTLVGGFTRSGQLTAGERFGVREFDVIGIHPQATLDTSNRAMMASEADFAQRFPWHPSGRNMQTDRALSTTWLKKGQLG